MDLVLWAGLLLGCILRFLPGVRTGFPVNDGGMLLAMSRDLQSNGFVLPAVTSYNFLDIPFAYPPLGMYLVAILSRGLSIPELELLRWLPPFVSTAIIFAFYWLAYRILDSRPKAIIAALFYALMPGSSDWLVMGGGLTRSLGILFSLFAIGYVYSLFRERRSKPILGLAALFCALAVLSHPEVGLQTAGICFLLWVFYGKNTAGIVNATLVAVGTVLLTAPWWLTVVYYHGFSPFWSAMHTGIRERLLASLFHSFFSVQGGLPILPIFEIIGIFAVLRKRDLLLIFWAFLPFAIDPRNAPAVATFPFLLLASEGIYYLYLELIRAYLKTFPSQGANRSITILASGSLALILFYLLYVSYESTSALVALSLSSSDRQTMAWVKANTPPGSRFLLLTNRGEISPMTDAYQEWFPVLAERQSLNTLQGKEWMLGSQFFSYSEELAALQACPDAVCLNHWLEEKNVQVDYLLVRKQHTPPGLMNSLLTGKHYRLVHEIGGTGIFAFQP